MENIKTNERVLGIKIDIHNFEEILFKIEEAVSQNKKITITYLTPHIANYCYKYHDFRNILNHFDVVYADGIGIVIASRLNGGSLKKRITLPDYTDNLFHFLIKNGLSVYLLGTKSSTINDAVRILKENYPPLRIAGYHDGYSTWGDKYIIEKINRTKPNLLLVGMGLPLQEKWIYMNKDLLDVNVIWTCGGLFDIVSNRIKRAPDWMLRNNLEWVYRLYKEPKRLWKRYLIGNPLFMLRVFRNLNSNKPHHAKRN